jgi:hypothetical protein
MIPCFVVIFYNICKLGLRLVYYCLMMVLILKYHLVVRRYTVSLVVQCCHLLANICCQINQQFGRTLYPFI